MWEMVELKDLSEGDGGHTAVSLTTLLLMEHTLVFLKVCNLEVSNVKDSLYLLC